MAVPRDPARRGAFTLLLLLAIVVGVSEMSDRVAQQAAASRAPSSYSHDPKGLKAVYRVLEQYRFRLRRLNADWRSLGPGDRLLVAAEPLRRDIKTAERDALLAWVRAGGTLLYLAEGLTAPNNSPFEGVSRWAAPPGSLDFSPIDANHPLARGVTALRAANSSRLRVTQESGYTALFGTPDNALVVTRTLGRGRVILAALSGAARNAAIGGGKASPSAPDTIVFLYNVADVYGGSGTVVFDEYHQGVGAEAGEVGRGVLAYLPLALQLAFWQGAALGILLLINANRRFGSAVSPASPRVSVAGYFPALARLLRRARAGETALSILRLRFARDLAYRLDVSPDNPQELAARASRTFGVDVNRLAAALINPIRPGGFVDSARELDRLRKDCALDD